MKKFLKRLDERLSIIPRFLIVLVIVILLIPIYPILFWDMMKDKDDSIVAEVLRGEL